MKFIGIFLVSVSSLACTQPAEVASKHTFESPASGQSLMRPTHKPKKQVVNQKATHRTKTPLGEKNVVQANRARQSALLASAKEILAWQKQMTKSKKLLAIVDENNPVFAYGPAGVCFFTDADASKSYAYYHDDKLVLQITPTQVIVLSSQDSPSSTSSGAFFGTQAKTLVRVESKTIKEGKYGSLYEKSVFVRSGKGWAKAGEYQCHLGC